MDGDDERSSTGTALDVAHRHALSWLDSLPDRPIRPDARCRRDPRRRLPGRPARRGDCRRRPSIEELAEAAGPGLIALGSPRFYGFVIGGAYPAALAADWLVSAWDQNTGARQLTPATAAVEEVAASLAPRAARPARRERCGVRDGCDDAPIFACLVAARDAVLRGAGADPVRRDPAGTRHPLPRRRRRPRCPSCWPAGSPVWERRRPSAPMIKGGSMSVASRGRSPSGTGPAIVALQAGDVHSGAFDDFAECDRGRPPSRRLGARRRGLRSLGGGEPAPARTSSTGLADADSWATDAHKTLNVPYDCGLAIVRDEPAMTAALGAHAAYLPADHESISDPYDRVPEFSRRARGVPVWAALRSLGRRRRRRR